MSTESQRPPSDQAPAPDFRLFFESAPGLYLVLTPDLTIVAASNAYLSATMTAREAIVGRQLFDVFPDNPDDPAASGVRNLKASLARVRQQRAPDTMAVQKYDIRRPESDGGGFDERFWSPINSPILNAAGEILYIIHRVVDVTDFVRLKQAEAEHEKLTEEARLQAARMEAEVYIRAQEVAEAHRQLSEAHAELERLLAKTRELDQIKTQFFANVSHELRTPLSLILGPIEVLLASPAIDDAARGRLEVVLRNARLLLKHVNDLLDVSKLEAGRMAVHYAVTDAAHLVRLTAGHFTSVAREKRIAFSIDAEGELPTELDEEKVQRVLMNLLGNAFKFTPDEGRIRCALRQVGDDLVIEVADSGPGIAAEHREQVFERFRQIEGGAARRHGGTGLGLAIARDFVVLHGGQIAIAAAPEGGALFTVRFPARAPAGAPVSARRERGGAADAAPIALAEFDQPRAPRSEPAPDSPSALPLALVVEDSVEMNQFVRDGLSSAFRTASARDGRQGLRLAVDLRPDLVVSDVMMPEMSGDELVRQLRATPEGRDVPILLLTAKVDDGLRVKLLQTGANDYVTKPFSIDELLARARNLVTIKTAQAVAEQATRAKNVFLSRMSHELRTPLNAILGFAQLMEMDEHLPGDQAEGVRQILRGGQHLLDLINEVLDICRIESGHLSLSPEPVSAREVVQAAIELVAPLAARRGVTIESALPAGDLVVRADRQRLSQILLNLLSNGVKYNRPRGRVIVGAEPSGSGRVRLTVRDTGAGIPPAKLALLFQPFERLGAEQSGVEGTGLGLALSRALAEAMGGTLGVETAIDVGSSFWLELETADRPLRAAAAAAGRGDEAGAERAGTILYIEDNLSNVHLMERVLARRPRVTLVHAPQGDVGLTFAREREPDVILLDLHLPDMSGEEVLRQLWEEPSCRDIPVVVLTADATPGLMRRLKAAGASGFLTKPIDVRGVLTLLDDLLGGKAASPGA